MRFTFIEQHRNEFRITTMCKVLCVSRSGYYAWRYRPVCEQKQRRISLTKLIRRVFVESKERYGSPRVHQSLLRRGVRVCLNTVARIMQNIRLFSRVKRKFKATTNSKHLCPLAPNILDRNFTPQVMNQVWAADITYVPTAEGWLYVAVVMDLCSRCVIGYAMQATMKSELVINALQMALDHRQPCGYLVHHSDRGVQYASESYQDVLEAHNITCSMSRKGNCWDNAVVESFIGTLKTELTHHECYKTREEAKSTIFEYIEVFYNRKRLHSSLDYLSPVEYERKLDMMEAA